MKRELIAVALASMLLTPATHGMRQRELNEQLLQASAQGEAATVVDLLNNRGAWVYAQSQRRETPLHWAAGRGHQEVVEILLDKRAEIDARNYDQSTPLHEAAFGGNPEVVEILLDKGAEIDARNNRQRTPLHNAAWMGHREVVEILLEKGAKIDARDNEQWTLLHLAAAGGRPEVVKLLLDKGAEIDARDNSQQTPLHIAAWNVVKLLLRAGANPYALNRRGQTPAEVARLLGARQAARILEAWQEEQLQAEKMAGRRDFMAARQAEHYRKQRSSLSPLSSQTMKLIAKYITPGEVMRGPDISADQPTRRRYITEQVEATDRRAIEQEQEHHHRQIEEARRMWMERLPAPAQ